MKSRGPSPFPPESKKRSEDNHLLLHNESQPPALTKDFCGHFNGFTLTPIKKNEPEPIRAAPPVPVVPPIPNVVIKSPVVSRANTTAETKPVPSTKPVMRTQSFKPNSIVTAISTTNSTSVAPALPPPNPGSHARPIISSPILENSTCTAKELLSPLRNAPKVPLRPAPEMPPINKETKRPLSSPDSVINTVTFADEVFKKPVKESNSALNRIASFLSKSNDKKPIVNTNSLPRSKTNKVIDKAALRNMEISSPIPQTTIDIAINALPVDTAENKAVVMRAQSMRGKSVTPRPNIPNFGSMRQQPGTKRPLSIPSASRPKSPPPPLPGVTETKKPEVLGIKIPGLPGYQKPTVNPQKVSKQNQYDDCLNEAPLAHISEDNSPVSGDNIYAVIDDTPSPEVKAVSNVKSNGGSSENMGLLGEIVSEIQNRNFDSIYSTSTLARKKKESELKKQKQLNQTVTSLPPSDIYVNAPAIYKPGESVYSNMGNIKSSASSTSSGYINPSSVHPPIKPADKKDVQNDNKLSAQRIPNDIPKTTLSTFKAKQPTDVDNCKPFVSTLNRSQGPLASTFKTKTSPSAAKKQVTNSSESKPGNNNNKVMPPQNTKAVTKPLNRQITPPNLRTRRPSPSRPAPPSPKTNPPTSNSPDLVTSCSGNNNGPNAGQKTPDVLNSGSNVAKKPSISAAKPVNLPKTAPKINKTTSLKQTTDKKISEKPTVSAKITKASSDAGIGSKVMPTGARIAARQLSNVASLQQKFENKPPISAKTVEGKNKV